MGRKRRHQAEENALSLFEVLITMALLALAAGLMAAVASQFARLLLWNDSHSQASFRQTLVHQVADELEQAIDLNLSTGPPGVGDTSATPLQFKKVDPVITARPPNPVPSPAPWRPDAASQLATVKVYMQAGRLVRLVQPSSGGPLTQTLGTGLSGFNVQRVSDTELQVRLTYLERDQLMLAETSVFWRLP